MNIWDTVIIRWIEASPAIRTVNAREWGSIPIEVKDSFIPRATIKTNGWGVWGWRRGIQCYE